MPTIHNRNGFIFYKYLTMICIKLIPIDGLKTVFRFVRCCLTLFVLLLWFSSCDFLPNPDDASTLTVAVIGPFSGELSNLGQSMRNGIVLAAEEQNAKGGVLGKQVQLRLFDSGCDYATARTAAQEAIRDVGAGYILGAVCGEASEGVAQIVSDEAVLMINPVSVNEDLTLDNNGELRPYVFRVPFIDPDQGSVAAKLALEKFNATTASVLVAETGNYESFLADAFIETFSENGGEVLLRESYDRMSETFYDALEELRDANADIIYAPSYYDVINKLAAQARIYGVNQVILGSDGWNSPELDKTFLEGCFYTAHFYVNEPRAVVIEWVKRYENRYLVLPDTVATLSYDAANVLFTAIERTGTTAPLVVAQSMEDMIFDTVTGQLSFDEMHNPIKPVIILRILNGNVVYDSRMVAHDVEE